MVLNYSKSVITCKNSTKRTVKYMHKLTLNNPTSYNRVRKKNSWNIERIAQSKEQSDATPEKMLKW